MCIRCESHGVVAKSATWSSLVAERIDNRVSAHANKKANLVGIEARKQRAVEEGESYRGRDGVV